MPEGLQIIGKGSFQGCTALLSITLPSTVTKLHRKAFSGCVNLAEVKLNEGLRLIDERAFQRCSALRSVTVPSTVNMWGRNIFWHCGNLSEVTFLGGKGLLKQEFIDRLLFDDEGGTLNEWLHGLIVLIIHGDLFAYCQKLRTFKISLSWALSARMARLTRECRLSVEKKIRNSRRLLN